VMLCDVLVWWCDVVVWWWMVVGMWCDVWVWWWGSDSVVRVGLVEDGVCDKDVVVVVGAV